MLKVKEILLRFQEDTKFIEKVANSNTIDKLYEVFCEYEYDSDINGFESEIYELLSNSDLVRESVDEEELERISGGANMRKKIMSVIALSSLAMGGIAPITHVDAVNVTAKPQSRKCYDTFLPIKEWETIGIVLLTTILGGGGYIYHRHTKSKSNTQVHMPTPITEFQESRDRRSGLDFSGFDDGGRNDEIYNFEGENGYDQALECIETWHKNEPARKTEFHPKIVDAVDKIEKTFFSKGKPEPTSEYRQITSLKSFPRNIYDCINKSKKYFVPLSWQNGIGGFAATDDYMLQKVIFQYLCRMLCFVLDGYGHNSDCSIPYPCVYYLTGTKPLGTSSEPPDYTALFRIMKQYPVVYEKYNNVHEKVEKLIRTLASMYNAAKSQGRPLPKCGVFCGENPRNIDN